MLHFESLVKCITYPKSTPENRVVETGFSTWRLPRPSRRRATNHPPPVSSWPRCHHDGSALLLRLAAGFSSAASTWSLEATPAGRKTRSSRFERSEVRAPDLLQDLYCSRFEASPQKETVRGHPFLDLGLEPWAWFRTSFSTWSTLLEFGGKPEIAWRGWLPFPFSFLSHSFQTPIAISPGCLVVF